LDQAYHPEGFYTFPSDEFTRNEILRAKQIGLNGVRVHIKVPLTRKLYWADRLGMLIMEDLPNFWSEPVPEAREESERTLRAMIERDYNHPSVFSWILFNETWGLRTEVAGEEVYLPETQEWVVEMYELAKELDPTRLVEDNSVCCNVGHTVTDLNTWHAYLPGWEWDDYLDTMADSVNYEDGWDVQRVPNVNSEFGNVWGYEGSTGDVDYSWDYHRAVNAFRRHPAIAGWLYTEHHDVINEWNGYWKYDRSDKITGMDALVDGMSLADLHAPLYIAVGDQLSRSVQPGEQVSVPLFASFMTGSRAYGEALVLHAELHGWNALGQEQGWWSGSRSVPYRPWMNESLEPLLVTMPEEPAVAVLAVRLEDAAGQVLQRNFTPCVVEGAPPADMTLPGGARARIVRFDPAAFSAADWSLGQSNVLDGLKVNGAGSGFFEYRVAWPDDVDPSSVQSAALVLEAGAKQLFGKEREDADEIEGDYMRGRGTLDNSRNPNAYPMTDLERFPSEVVVRVNGVRADRRLLEDDPADHRGILSWHSQLRDRRLREAGSYGQLLQVALPPEALERAAQAG
ncbi:MAG: glycoside hydrolase family 2 TIM barrel-domain containing protein, partial [Gemmatimonadota bacterium]